MASSSSAVLWESKLGQEVAKPIEPSQDNKSALIDDGDEKRDSGAAYSALKDSLLTVLECPVCFETMQRPIFLCAKGHSVCSGCTQRLQSKCPMCKQPLGGQARNFCLENLADAVDVPCDRCGVPLRPAEKKGHANKCSGRPIECPFKRIGLVFLGKCAWQGSGAALDAHLATSHVGTDAWMPIFRCDSHPFIPLKDPGSKYHLIVFDSRVFMMTFKVIWNGWTSVSNKYHLCVKLLGGAEDDANHYKIQLHFQSQVTSIQFETSPSFPIHSDLTDATGACIDLGLESEIKGKGGFNADGEIIVGYRIYREKP